MAPKCKIDVDDAIGSAAGPGGSAAADDAAADDGADEAAVDEDGEPLPPGDDHGTAKCCPALLAAWKSLRAKIKRDPQHIHPAAERVRPRSGSDGRKCSTCDYIMLCDAHIRAQPTAGMRTLRSIHFRCFWKRTG